MHDEDDEGMVTVNITALLHVERTTRMPRADAERIRALQGFELRNAVDEELVFDSSDVTGLEDVTMFEIEEDEDYSDEEEE